MINMSKIAKVLTAAGLVALCVVAFLKPSIANTPNASTSGFNAWGNEIITDLAKLPEIQIRDFPLLQNSEALQAGLRVIQADLPTSFDSENDLVGNGELISPLNYLTAGHFDLMGFTSLSLGQIGQKTGVNTGELPIGEFSSLLSILTPKKLLEISAFEKLANLPISDTPLLDSVLSNYIAQIRQVQLDPETLEPLIREALPDLDGKSFSDLTLSQAVAEMPDFGNVPLTQADPALLDSMPVQEALPELNSASLNEMSGASELPLSSLEAANVGSLSLSQMPSPLSLVPGVQIGLADISLGTPSQGDREQNRVRVVSGGIPSNDMILVGANCIGDSCPHFEVSNALGGASHGAAWMDATGQEARDGFGPLCLPWDCKGPPGNHPFGPGARVLFKNINQSTGTAEIALSFPYCKTLIFVDRTCTPWALPVPEGIPIGKIAEKSLIAYINPGAVIPGEITDNPFPNPHEPEATDLPASPTGPVPPPQPCDGSDCTMLNPLPRMSGAGIYSRFRRRRPSHAGVDIQSAGAPGVRPTANAHIVAPADGVVTFTCNVGDPPGIGCRNYGAAVEIHHPQLGIYTFSSHMYRRTVNRGDRVTRGQVIGVEGGAGARQGQYGTHDHFEVRTRGGAGAVKVDPEGYRFSGPTMIPPRPKDLFG